MMLYKTPKKTLQWQIKVSQEKLRINESHHCLQTKKCVLTLKEICVFIVIFVQDREFIKPTTCQFLTLELKSMVSSTFMEELIRMCPQFTRSFNNHWIEISICLIMSPMNSPLSSQVVMSWYGQVNSLKINEIRYYHIAFIISINFYFNINYIN